MSEIPVKTPGAIGTSEHRAGSAVNDQGGTTIPVAPVTPSEIGRTVSQGQPVKEIQNGKVEAKASKTEVSEVDVKEVILRRVPGDKWKAEFKGRIRQMDINRLTMALRSEWNRHKVARRVARRKAENEARKELVKNG